MKRRTEKPVDSQVLTFWRGRVALLDQMLADGPTAQQAWFWNIQRDIISYMLNRYADGVAQLAKNPDGVIAAAELSAGLNPQGMQVRPSESFDADSGSGRNPRVAGNIRPVLASIALVNQQRYEILQQLDEEIRERLRIEYARMLDAIPRSTPGYYVEPPPEMLGVSDDEILGILSGKIEVELPPDHIWDDDSADAS